MHMSTLENSNGAEGLMRSKKLEELEKDNFLDTTQPQFAKRFLESEGAIETK